MKTILYNTLTEKTVGKPREGYYTGIYNSNISTVAGELPEFIIQLEVVSLSQPEYNPATHALRDTWAVDVLNLTYSQVWSISDLSQEEKDKFEQHRIEQWLASLGWHHPQFNKRIIAPVDLVMQYPQVETWFRINDLPIVRELTTLYCYCNVILAAHQQLIDALQGVITVEDLPTE